MSFFCIFAKDLVIAIIVFEVQIYYFAKKTINLQKEIFKKEEISFDLVFLDPPYHKGILQKALPLTAEVMNEGGIIVCEHAADEPVPEEAGKFVKRRTYQYGKIMLTVYEHRNMVEE